MYFQWEEEEEHHMMPKQTVSQIRPYMGSNFIFFSSFFKSKYGWSWFFKACFEQDSSTTSHPTTVFLFL
jgi:hypothetical protein